MAWVGWLYDQGPPSLPPTREDQGSPDGKLRWWAHDRIDTVCRGIGYGMAGIRINDYDDGIEVFLYDQDTKTWSPLSSYSYYDGDYDLGGQPWAAARMPGTHTIVFTDLQQVQDLGTGQYRTYWYWLDLDDPSTLYQATFAESPYAEKPVFIWGWDGIWWALDQYGAFYYLDVGSGDAYWQDNATTLEPLTAVMEFTGGGVYIVDRGGNINFLAYASGNYSPAVVGNVNDHTSAATPLDSAALWVHPLNPGVQALAFYDDDSMFHVMTTKDGWSSVLWNDVYDVGDPGYPGYGPATGVVPIYLSAPEKGIVFTHENYEVIRPGKPVFAGAHNCGGGVV